MTQKHGNNDFDDDDVYISKGIIYMSENIDTKGDPTF